MARNTATPGIEFRLDGSQCVGCAVCADVCLDFALVMGSTDLRPTWLAALCTGCGLCEVECPTAAIRMAPVHLAPNGSITSG